MCVCLYSPNQRIQQHALFFIKVIAALYLGIAYMSPRLPQHQLTGPGAFPHTWNPTEPSYHVNSEWIRRCWWCPCLSPHPRSRLQKHEDMPSESVIPGKLLTETSQRLPSTFALMKQAQNTFAGCHWRPSESTAKNILTSARLQPITSI